MRKQRRKCVPQHKKTKTVRAVVEKAVADEKNTTLETVSEIPTPTSVI